MKPNSLISTSLIARLTQASERIKRASEELDGAIKSVETFLMGMEMRFTGATWVEAAGGPYRLTFAPNKAGEWRLMLDKVRMAVDGGSAKAAEVEQSWPLIDAAKPLQLAAASEIPSLIESIAAQATSEADKIEAALTAIKGQPDEVTIVDKRTREKLDREFLELYSKRMSEEARVGA